MRKSERNLRKENLGQHVDNGEIIIDGAQHVTVCVMDADFPNMVDWDKTDALMSKVADVLGWGGSRAAGGWWNLYNDWSRSEFENSLADQIGAPAYS